VRQLIVSRCPTHFFPLHRSIRIGNTLHKTAVLSGLGALVAGGASLSLQHVITPLASLSLCCGLSYNVFWHGDPLCQYQVARDGSDLDQVSVAALPAEADDLTVLQRRDDRVRRVLHNSLMLSATFYALYKLRQKGLL
jgi:predicted dienelactone hydrolase